MTTLSVTRWGARLSARRFPCAIGRGGITRSKREGDGATPAGRLAVTGLLYRPDRVARAQVPRWAQPIGPFDIWSDDPEDPDYNHLVNGGYPRGFSAERLARPDPLYDLVLLTNWNWPDAVAGRGSAIFLHSWRKPRHPTEGCVAFARRDLLWLSHRLAPGAAVYVT